MKLLIAVLLPFICTAGIRLKQSNVYLKGNGDTLKDYVICSNLTNVTIDGYILDGRTANQTKSGFNISNSTNITIKNCYISNFAYSGINAIKCKNLLIENCIVTGNGIAGIYIEGVFKSDTMRIVNSNVTIRKCNAYKNTGRTDWVDNWSGSGILMVGTDIGSIENCTAYENGSVNVCTSAGPVGIWVDNSKSVTIRGCTSFNNKGGPGRVDGGGFDIDGGSQNCTIDNCTSYDNEGAGYSFFQWGNNKWLNNKVINCSSDNDGIGNYGNLTFWGQCVNGEISNCSITRSKSGNAIRSLGGGFSGIVIKDNTFCVTPPATLNNNLGAGVKMINNTTVCPTITTKELQKNNDYVVSKSEFYNYSDFDFKIFTIQGQFLLNANRKRVTNFGYLPNGVYIAASKNTTLKLVKTN